MTQKHTPGPWVRDCWDILGSATRHGGGTGHVCLVSTPNGDDDKYWEPGEADANACLIAAAPDLLEAAKKIVFDWDGEPEDMADARAAIARAEGGGT